MNQLHRITTDPAIRGGRPCLRGTRVRVNDTLDLLAAGVSNKEILVDHPYLDAGDIVASLEYASLQPDHIVLKAA